MLTNDDEQLPIEFQNARSLVGWGTLTRLRGSHCNTGTVQGVLLADECRKELGAVNACGVRLCPATCHLIRRGGRLDEGDGEDDLCWDGPGDGDRRKECVGCA